MIIWKGRIVMSDPPSANKPTVLAEITLVPLENEQDDLETLSAVEDVAAEVLSETNTLQDYTTQVASGRRSGAEVILLLGEIARQAITQKDLIIAFLQAGTAAIGALAKQHRVSKIEVSLDGDSFSIENPDTVTAQRLLDIFEAKHPGITPKMTPSSRLQVTGQVSKKAQHTSK
jgi:hypothetical protein